MNEKLHEVSKRTPKAQIKIDTNIVWERTENKKDDINFRAILRKGGGDHSPATKVTAASGFLIQSYHLDKRSPLCFLPFVLR